MRILHTVAGLWAGIGGPVASVTSLCRELARRGHEVCLLTGQGALHSAVRGLPGDVRLRLEPLGPYWLANGSLAFRRACREEARRADVVHDHGVWLHTNWASAWAAAGAGRPLVRSPRGMLSPWALGRSRLRKRVLWALVERKLFADAAVVHVTSQLEEHEVRSLGAARKLEVIANGIDTDDEFAAPRVEEARAAAATVPGGRHKILFLSRLHPKKGLDLLCQAWSALPNDSMAELLIAGDGGPDSVGELRRWAASQPGPPAKCLGRVEGEERLRLLASAWAFVLPSRSENYGMAVAEALACGTPALTTTETPWHEIVDRECGWLVEPRVPELLGALRQVLSVGEEAHVSMRKRARLFIEEAHSLRVSGARFETVYGALAGLRAGMEGAR